MLFPLPSYKYCMNVLQGSTRITSLEIGKDACPYKNVTVFDLNKYSKLKTVMIGHRSFYYVKEVKIIGLKQLERVEIGDRSFTRYRNSYDKDPNRHFYLKDCPKLKSLKMGRFSFSDYSVIEIENVDALESIVMGDLEKESDNFAYAPLELKSILIHSE